MPVWWNCQDFAIRLGYLLTVGDETREILSFLLKALRVEMRREVIERRGRLLGYLSHVEVQIGILNVNLGVVEGCCMTPFDLYRRKIWQSYMAHLEDLYPRLEQLHGNLKAMY